MEIFIICLKPSFPKISADDFKLLKSSIETDYKATFNTTDISVNGLYYGSISNSNFDFKIILKGNIKGLNAVQMIRNFENKLSDTFNFVLKSYIEKPITLNVSCDENFQVPRVSKAQNGVSNNNETSKEKDELDYEKRAENYKATEPLYSFDRVIIPKKVLDKIEEALSIIKYENKVFKEWGLSVIQPHPSSSLSFFGPSGTGKTMAAEAIAQKLGKKILKVSYADVESKFHGEGPKMMKAIFCAATRDDAVLFFDEADSLLSKRLTNVTQGSEQAINSMRSQLLICLEEFKGIVIFATNLVVNYDQAFLTRLISVEFVQPDIECRTKIWNVHIYPSNENTPNKLNIPLAEDVNTNELAEKYEFCGREIRNAVISACVSAAMQDKEEVAQIDFINACNKIIDEKESLKNAKDNTIANLEVNKKPLNNPLLEDTLKQAFKEKLH